MTDNKRYVAIPETVSYKDTATNEILCLKVEKDYYEVLSLLNHFHDAWFGVHEGLEQISKEYDELAEENQSLLRKNGAMEEEIECLTEENEQLKQRNKRFEEKIQRERNSFTKTHERWSKEAETKIKELSEENEQLKQFIQELTTKGTGRIDLADGYSYSVSAILTNWKGDVE